MTAYSYYICDVFTKQRFGGNPLAVIPDARGLRDVQMQQIAREFNLSETTFVLPPEQGHTRRVRIFTPKTEIPFAGHPNIGTAFVLAQQGLLEAASDRVEDIQVVFEEGAGLVPIRVQRDASGAVRCELQAPNPLSLGQTLSSSLLAASLSLSPEAIMTTVHQPQVASVGLPFIMCQLVDRAALAKVRIDLAALDVIQVRGVMPDIHAYVLTPDADAPDADAPDNDTLDNDTLDADGRNNFDIHARMFSPFDGVPEDPATGSANCALVALLSHYSDVQDGHFRWRIAQGVDMGRPSVLEARTEKRAGEVTGVWIGGNSVMVAEGTIRV